MRQSTTYHQTTNNIITVPYTSQSTM